MNRAFLIALVPAAVVAIAYLLAASFLGVQLNAARLVIAVAGLFAVAGAVYWYRRRKARLFRG